MSVSPKQSSNGLAAGDTVQHAELAKPIHPGWYGAGIVGGFITFGIAVASLALMQKLTGLSTTAPQSLLPGYDWWMVLLLVAVQPAVFEEMAFRGVMFGGFGHSLRGVETIAVTALMFMVLHLSVPAFPHLLIMGVLLGWMRHRSGSWLPGVFLHFVHNFLCIVLA